MPLHQAIAHPTKGAVIQPLHPGLRPRVRTDGTIQLGHDPVHGVILTGLTPYEAAPVSQLLRLLSGATAPMRVRTLSGTCGLPEDRVLEIAETLEHAGLMLSGTPALSTGNLAAWSLARRRLGPEHGLGARVTSTTLAERRAGARVTIDGRGPLALEIGRLLTSAHIGHIQSGWYAGAAEDLDRASPDPGLIITVSTRLPRSRAARWQARGIAHLPLVAGDASVDIGPLIIPGSGPCVSCMARQESPGLQRFGVDDPIADGQGDPVLVEPALAAMAAGTAAMLALGHVDAYPPPVGLRWHCALPLPSLAVSRWEKHPACDVGAHRIPILDETMTR